LIDFIAGYYLINKENTYANVRDKIDNILLKCDGTGICNIINTEEFTTYQYYLDTHSNMVISCPGQNESCILEDPTIKGYFLNSGTEEENNTNKIIKCSGNKEKPCEIIDGEEDVSCTSDNIGKILKSSLKLCISEVDSVEMESKMNGNSQYINIETKHDNDFPGTNAGNISIKIGNDGSIILLENIRLPTCKESINTSESCFDGAANEQYCISSDKRKFYKTVINNSGSKCTQLRITNPKLFFDNNFEKIEINNSRIGTIRNIMAYLCKSSCEIVRGYIIDNDKYYQCNGWKREGCIINDILTSKDSCPDDIIDGKLQNISNKNVLCFGMDKFIIPENEEYIAFEAKDINPIYGSESDKIVLLSSSKISNLYSVIVTDDIISKYYNNNYY